MRPIGRKDDTSRASSIIIRTKRQLYVIAESDIKYLQADSNYCFIVLADGRKILSSKTLKLIASLLTGRGFVKSHSGYIVNLNFVTAISPSYTKLILDEGEHIPIARSRKKLVQQIIHTSYAQAV